MSYPGHNIDLHSRKVEGSWPPTSCATVEDAWEMLLVDGWTIVADTNSEFGLDPAFREYVCAEYFGEHGILEPEQYDVFPPDRKRARGLVEVRTNLEGEITLRDMPPAPVMNKDRGVNVGQRIYRQTELVGDDRFCHWLATLSGLIPPPVEYIHGAMLDENDNFDSNVFFGDLRSELNKPFYAALTGQLEEKVSSQLLRKLSGAARFISGVNLFEVSRDVVSGPHQDNTHWNAITVLEKHGEGATSQLFKLDSPEPVVQYTLAPGQTLIINDRRFRHSATPLEPAADGAASYRRTVICTFDFAATT